MNTINSVGMNMAKDGLKSYTAELQANFAKPQIQPVITPTGAEVAADIARTNEDTKADAQHLQKISDMVMGGEVQFNVNSELGSVVVKIVDPKTEQVLKEIPSADIQKLKVQIRKTIGILFDRLI